MTGDRCISDRVRSFNKWKLYYDMSYTPFTQKQLSLNLLYSWAACLSTWIPRKKYFLGLCLGSRSSCLTQRVLYESGFSIEVWLMIKLKIKDLIHSWEAFFSLRDPSIVPLANTPNVILFWETYQHRCLHNSFRKNSLYVFGQSEKR